MQVVPLYAALLALIFAGLSVRTLRLRRRLRVEVGDAGNEHMLRAMRAHANFAEYVPLSLILFFLVEESGASNWVIHGLGMCLLLGRIVHAYGVSQVPEPGRYRAAGMAFTLTPMIIAALQLLAVYALTPAA